MVIFLVSEGRSNAAADQLQSMLSTLWKRTPSLHQITVHDTWGSLASACIVRKLLAAGSARSWRTMHELRHIQIEIPHKDAPVDGKPLYEKPDTLTKTNITARHNVKGWKAALTWGPEGWRTPGAAWLEVGFE